MGIGMHTAKNDAIRGMQEVVVRVVDGGYSPSSVRVKAGRPVRLTFDRQEASGCSEIVGIPEFGIRVLLPPFQTTTVEFTPAEPGTYSFGCGMGMLRGEIFAGQETRGLGLPP
jgi:plastocyanin domain-containing protein